MLLQRSRYDDVMTLFEDEKAIEGYKFSKVSHPLHVVVCLGYLRSSVAVLQPAFSRVRTTSDLLVAANKIDAEFWRKVALLDQDKLYDKKIVPICTNPISIGFVTEAPSAKGAVQGWARALEVDDPVDLVSIWHYAKSGRNALLTQDATEDSHLVAAFQHSARLSYYELPQISAVWIDCSPLINVQLEPSDKYPNIPAIISPEMRSLCEERVLSLRALFPTAPVLAFGKAARAIFTSEVGVPHPTSWRSVAQVQPAIDGMRKIGTMLGIVKVPMPFSLQDMARPAPTKLDLQKVSLSLALFAHYWSRTCCLSLCVCHFLLLSPSRLLLLLFSTHTHTHTHTHAHTLIYMY